MIIRDAAVRVLFCTILPLVAWWPQNSKAEGLIIKWAAPAVIVSKFSVTDTLYSPFDKHGDCGLSKGDFDDMLLRFNAGPISLNLEDYFIYAEPTDDFLDLFDGYPWRGLSPDPTHETFVDVSGNTIVQLCVGKSRYLAFRGFFNRLSTSTWKQIYLWTGSPKGAP